MSKRLRILNVEDSERDALLLIRHITSAGYAVENARVDDAESMRRALESGSWDVVLCDYAMPRFSSAGALNVLHESGLDIPLITISGTANEETAVEVMLTGANDFLSKSNLSRLIPAIERELTEAANRRVKRRAESEMAILYRIIQGAVTSTDLDGFLDLVYKEINERVFAENCFVALWDPSDDSIHFDFWRDSVDPQPPPRAIDKGFASYVLRSGEPLLVTKEKELALYQSGDAELIGSSSASWLGVPLITPACTIGVLVIQDYEHEDRYDQRDLEFMASVGDQVAMAVERKRSEVALRRSEERYRQLVEDALDIIYTHDMQGNYTSVNRAAEAITGFTREETLQMNLIDVIAPEYVEMAKKMISAKLKGEENTAYQLEVIVKGGVRKSLEVNTRIVFENGVPVGVQGIARDVTERAQLEAKLRQSQKLEAIGLLAGGVAHDFNNLLTVISGYSDLALMKIKDDPDLQQNIEEIRNAGQRAAELTGQLLAFGRKQVLNPKVHNLNSIISNLKKMLNRVVRENIVLKTDLAPDLGNVQADSGQIEQVIMNLTVNARDAMPDGGTLTIRTSNAVSKEAGPEFDGEASPSQFVRISVTDTGVGIDEDTQLRMFEPFYTTKDTGKGSGLGLSTVHGIVKQSGGSIFVHSEVGVGTRFDIYLPWVMDDVHVSDRVGFTEDNVSGRETILLVEDDENVRQLAGEVLRSNGYLVLEASSGADALSICRVFADTIHLLLTDVIMPEMSGPELSAQIAKIRPETKRMFMSGYADDAITREQLFDPSNAFLEKPFTTDGLGRKIREVLDN